MKRIMLLGVLICISLALQACGQANAGLSEHDQSVTGQEAPPDTYEPREMDEPPAEATPYPGLPVYRQSEAWAAAEEAAQADPDGEPQPMPSDHAMVFEYYEDPPPDGTIRLVYVYNYGETETLLIEDSEEVAEILAVADAFELSDYDSGPLMGGSYVEIQAVRDGVHQCYSVLSGKHNGGYIAINGRDADNWYWASTGNYHMLMDYFGGVPE